MARAGVKKKTKSVGKVAAEKEAVDVGPFREAPEPPGGLRGHAVECWREVAALLVGQGTLTRLQLAPLEALAREWGTYLRLSEWLDEDVSRWTFATDTGYQSETPEVRLRAAALGASLKLWQRLGIVASGKAKASPIGELQRIAGERSIHDEDSRP